VLEALPLEHHHPLQLHRKLAKVPKVPLLEHHHPLEFLQELPLVLGQNLATDASFRPDLHANPYPLQKLSSNDRLDVQLVS
jgi:hypothetical protein